MTCELQRKIGSNAIRRFIPYVQMYEFEGLLFSSPSQLASGIGKPDLSPHFQSIRDSFDTPETINNSKDTAPSKRILKLFREYQKNLYGPVAALEIGLSAIRLECPRFDAWLRKIEALRLQC